MANGPRARRPPVWPLVMLGAFALLATLSLLQGIVDVVIPALRQERAFGFLFSMTEAYGPGFFVAYIFVHNLGLASIVPGFGFVAARFERNRRNRFIIGILLLLSVIASIIVAIQFILTAPASFDLALASALLFGEACGVLALAFAATRQLRDFVPTRAYPWSLVHPFRQLKIPLGFSATLLLLLAIYEAWAVLGA